MQRWSGATRGSRWVPAPWVRTASAPEAVSMVQMRDGGVPSALSTSVPAKATRAAKPVACTSCASITRPLPGLRCDSNVARACSKSGVSRMSLFMSKGLRTPSLPAER